MKTHFTPRWCSLLILSFFSINWLDAASGQIICAGRLDASLNPAEAVSIGEAVDTPDLDWTALGTASWFGQTNVTSDGVDAAAVRLDGCDWGLLETTFSGPGYVSWRWRMVDPPGGQGTVSIGMLQGGSFIRAGSWTAWNHEWNQAITDVPAGIITMRWGFDGPCTGDPSIGYLDSIVIATENHPAAPFFTLHPVGDVASPGDCVRFECEAIAYPPTGYQWFLNGIPIPHAEHSILLISNITSASYGTYTVAASNSLGGAVSQPALLSPPTISIARALDTPGRAWRTTPGCSAYETRWVPQTSVTHDGTDAMVGRGFGCQSAGWIETSVNGPGTVSFWWKTYTSADWFESDDVRFFVVNTNNGFDAYFGLPGNADWRQETVSFGPGQKILRWETHGYCDGHDMWTTGWLDHVVITDTPTVVEPGCTGSADPSFASVRIESNNYPAARDRITALAVQPDGKVIVGGRFERVQGAARPSLIRLNSNGTLDPALPVLADEAEVHAIAQQPDGKLLIGGTIGLLSNAPQSGLARLNSNGTLDTTFTPTDMLNVVYGVVTQPDGSIMVSGYYTIPPAPTPFALVRARNDGSIDETFQFNGRSSNPITNVVSDGSGWIYFNGTSRCNISGTVDTTFHPDVGDLLVGAAALDAEGRLLLAGRRSSGAITNLVVRLNGDGSIDGGFHCPSITMDPAYNNCCAEVMALLPSPDGKIIISGRFGFVGSLRRPTVARLDDNGSVDPAFQPEIGFCPGCDDPEFVSALALTGGDDLMVAGYFSSANGLPRESVARLHLTHDGCGGVVSMSTPEVLVNESEAAVWLTVTRRGNTNLAATIQYQTSDDSGWWQPFLMFSPAAAGRDYVAQRGMLQFNPGETTKSVAVPLMNNLQLEANRYFTFSLIAGADAVVGDIPATRVVILDDENAGRPGSIDLTFHPDIVAWPYTVAAPDLAGGIIVAEGATYGNAGACRVKRLRGDGTTDPTFSAATFNAYVFALACDGSNRVVVAGAFTSVNGTNCSRIVRLLADGSVDPTFSANVNGTISRLLLLPGGKIAISGAFSAVDETVRPAVARLLSNGGLDLAFDPGAGPMPRFASDYLPGPIYGLAVQADGKLLLCGAFQTFDETPHPALVRLTENGSVDPSFNFQIALYDYIYSVFVLPDQKILVGGFGYDGRLNPDGTVDDTFQPDAGESIDSIAVQPDGKVIVNGRKRLNMDGSLDTSFFAGAGMGYGYAAPPIVLADGRIMVFGDFTRFNEVTYPGLVLLNGGTIVAGAGRIGFTSATAAVLEGDPTISVALRRDCGTNGAVAVSYATYDESAFAGIDYTALSGTLTFGNGIAGEQVLTIPIVNNNNAVGERRFRVSLGTPTGGAILGVPSSIAVDIYEDDVGVVFQSNQLWQVEGNAALVTLQRVGPVGEAFEVHFSATPGTATAGLDFQTMETNVAFSSHDTTCNVAIPLFPDSIAEPDESIQLTLSNPSNGVKLGTPGAATLWISDDDRPPCIVASYLATNGFRITLDMPPMASVVLEGSTNLVNWERINYFYRYSGEDMPHFIDTRATNHAMRFYRFRP